MAMASKNSRGGLVSYSMTIPLIFASNRCCSLLLTFGLSFPAASLRREFSSEYRLCNVSNCSTFLPNLVTCNETVVSSFAHCEAPESSFGVALHFEGFSGDLYASLRPGY